MNPLVSIITPTYNRKNLLEDAVKSVLSQTYSNYEHIIVNDGGEDVGDIIAKYYDDRIKYYNLKKNYGRSSVRNFALRKAKGEIICYLDDDVIYLTNHLKVIVDFFNNKQAKVCFTDAYYCIENVINGKRKVIYKRKFFNFPDKINYDNLYVGNFIDLNSFAHKKCILPTTGLFNPKLKAYVDWEFILRVYKHYKIHHIPQITNEYRIRLNADNISHPAISIKNAIRNHKKVYLLHPVKCKKIIAKREERIKNIKKIKYKIYYLNKRISKIQPDLIVIFGTGMDYFNPITFCLKKKINFILDPNFKKDKFIDIPIVNVKDLKKELKNQKILFILYEYIDLNIFLAKKFLYYHFGKKINISIGGYDIKNISKNIIKKINMLTKFSKMAIFGLGISGKKTFEFLENYFPHKVKYFVDDFKTGNYQEVPIVTTQKFITDYQKEVDCVVYGAYQKVNPYLIKNLSIPHIRLENII